MIATKFKERSVVDFFHSFVSFRGSLTRFSL